MDLSLITIFYFSAAVVVAGIAAGLIAGLLGVGGGIVLVPVLFYLFTLLDIDSAIRMHLAVGTSLSTIIATAYSSSRAHYLKGSIDIDLLKNWGPSLFIGAVIGIVIFSQIKSDHLSLVFAIITLLIAIYMLFKPNQKDNVEPSFPKGPLRHIYGLIVSSLSSIMGIGGGTLSVPLLTIYHYPIRKAVGTAAAIGLIIAIPGTIGAFLSGMDAEGLPPFSIGYVNVLAFLILIPITWYFAPKGARLAHSISPKVLRLLFAIFLIFNSANMFYSAFN